MGFKKVDEQYAPKAENDLVNIMSTLFPAWGWSPDMVDQNRGVKRAREDDEEEGGEDGKEGKKGEEEGEEVVEEE